MEYTAFISYSHAADSAVAAALQRSLYKFAKPWYRRRMVRVFRDKTSLAANPGLWPALQGALSASEFLILMASPKSAQSPWIGREVAWWTENRSIEKLLIVLTGGDIFWDEGRGDFDWERTNALPAVLKNAFAEEPLHIDMRWTAAGSTELLSARGSKFRDATLDLASALRGVSKDELDGEDLRQHRRTRRIAWSAGTALLLLAVAFGTAAWYATQQRDLAVARNVAARASLALAEGKVELGGLLAIEAIRLRRSLESDNAIRRALELQAAPEATLKFGEEVKDLETDGTGRWVAIAGEERLALWDSATANVVELLPRIRTESLALAREGQRVLAIDANGNVFLWDGNGNRRQAATAARIHTAAVSHDGRWAVLVDASGGSHLWDVDGGSVRVLDAPASESLQRGQVTAAVNADGSTVVVGGGRTLRVWKSGSLVSERIPPDDWKATGIEVAPDATRLATYDLRTRVLEVREAESGSRLARLATGAGLSAFHMSEGGGRVLTLGNTGGDAIAVWDVEARALLSVAHQYNVFYKNFAISGDGNRLVTTVDLDKAVRVWNVHHEQPLNLGPYAGAATLLGVSGDAKRVLLWDNEKRIRLLDTSTGREIWTWAEPMPARQALLSADGQHVLVVTEDGKSIAVSADTGANSRPVTFTGPADDIAIGADGQRAVAVDQESAGVINAASARIWNTQTGELLTTVPVQQRVFRTSLSRDGRRLLLGDRNELWMRRLSGWLGKNRSFEIGREVSATSLSPDGSLLAAVSGENIVEAWNVDSGEPVLYWPSPNAIAALAFAVDGQSLVLVFRSGRGVSARRLLLQPDDLIAEVCARIARNLSEQEWDDYVGAGSPRPSCPQVR